MGRELQKKKNRSSISKVKHKPKSKRLNVLGNAIVAANWNQELTLSQNYRHLGLTSKLNTRTGGVEKSTSQLEKTHKPSVLSHDPLSVASKLPTIITPSEARIERDATTGAILRVIHSPSSHKSNLNDPLDNLSDESNDGHHSMPFSGGIVPELEELASMELKRRPRQQSQREEEWIARLVDKHGEDYGRMVRDRKLNPYQQGEGDLRRRVSLWKQKRR